MQIECNFLIGFTNRRTYAGKTKLYKLHITQIIIINKRYHVMHTKDLQCYHDHSKCSCNMYMSWAILVVIIWWIDLRLPLQSVPIITKVVSENPAHGEVHMMHKYVIMFVQ